MKYYCTDLGNLEYWGGGRHPLSKQDVAFFNFKEDEKVKIYGEDLIANGLVVKDDDGSLKIIITSEVQNLDDKTVEKMDGAFKNGERFGRDGERTSIKMNLKTLGYNEEEIQKILNYKVKY